MVGKVIQKLLKNDKFQFIATKYATYFVYFIISIVVANKLGLFYFGVYGFLKLLLQYFTFSNFGVNYSGMVMMSERSNSDDFNNKILSSSIVVSIASFCLIFILFIVIYNKWFPELNEKYLVRQYLPLFFFIVIFKQINQLFINLNRIYNKLRIINWAYIIPCLGELLVLLFGKEAVLFRNICWAMAISNGLVTVLFFVKNTFIIKWILEKKLICELISRGFKLLLYNISFYFIILVAKSFMSSHYSVEDFAQYSFSYNISEAIMLLNNAISFLVYPKLLNQLYNSNNVDERKNILRKMQENYMLVANLIIIVAFIALPVFTVLVPSYDKIGIILPVLLLSQLFIANTFTLTTNLVQQKKELQLIILGAFTIGLSFLMCYFMSEINNNIEFVSYALAIALFLYNIGITLFNKRVLQLNFKQSISLMSPLFFIPIIGALITNVFLPHIASSLVFVFITVLLFNKRYVALVKTFYNAQ